MRYVLYLGGRPPRPLVPFAARLAQAAFIASLRLVCESGVWDFRGDEVGGGVAVLVWTEFIGEA